MSEHNRFIIIIGVMSISVLLNIIFVEWTSLTKRDYTNYPALVEIFEYEHEEEIPGPVVRYVTQVSIFGIYPAPRISRTTCALLGLVFPTMLFFISIYIISGSKLWQGIQNRLRSSTRSI